MTITSKFTKEFRDQAIRLVRQEKHGLARTARELGVGRSTLQAWLRRCGEPRAAEGVAGETPEQEVLRLRKENRILQMERDILKKATAFFANENR